jgi:hypothetical protein
VTRRESLLALAVALALIVAGLVWLFGPYGLIAGGIALAASTLFAFERVSEVERGEAVANAVPQRQF